MTKSKIKDQRLKIKNLRVSTEGKEIIKGVSLEIKAGEVHALMGPNGSGKSTLANALAGHPDYSITGKVLLGRREITALNPERRFRAGLFLAFQYPTGIEGVSLFNLIKTVRKDTSATVVLDDLRKIMPEVGLEDSFLKREVNLDLSGGEKKRSEVLQALALRPKFAIFDEIDSGLDIDALKMIAENIRRLAEGGTGVLVITHYQRILKYINPDFVHLLIEGRLAATGGVELAEKLEKEGYRAFYGERSRTIR